jgi:hypothetical protein
MKETEALEGEGVQIFKEYSHELRIFRKGKST